MIKIGIVGGTGYTGIELLRLCLRHPQVECTVVTSRTDIGIPVADIFPNVRKITGLCFSAPDTPALLTCDVVFFATPHGVAMQYAPQLLSAGIKVIDLSADFRFHDAALYETWYKTPHHCPELLKESAYGLVELNRAAIRTARIIGNPGCYPTTIQLGFAPLLAQGIIDASQLIADCKSGVSGAGRKAEISLLFSEASDNFAAYGVSGHRHLPETETQLARLTTDTVSLIFTPHLVPMIRGMHSTLYARLKAEYLNLDNITLQKIFEDFYRDERFIDVLPWGSHPQTRATRGSNQLHLSVHRPDGGALLVILVVQDNLVKGAAGQALQCMNVLCGLDEALGLDQLPCFP